MDDHLGKPARRHLLRSAGVAFVFVAAAFVLTLILRHVALRAYFLLFIPAVMFSTWRGGRAAGMIASVLTVMAAVYLLPRTEVVDSLAWVIVAAVVTFGTSAMTETRRRAETVLTARAAQESSRRREAESLSQLKTDLLAQVAHELRQPLNAVTAAAGLLEMPGSDDTGRQRAIGTIVRQTKHLSLLIDDLLDLSRLSRQQLQLHKSNIDLCDIVDDSLNVIAADVAARRIDVSTSLPPCPVHLTADPTRVRQILSNLLSNAVKFTAEDGKIELTLERTASHVVVRVRDNGRGISPDHLPVIFDMFQKGKGDGTGLGVGLAVAKGLAEMHGGSVEARSDGPGSGSEFVVRLPTAPAPAA